MQVVAAVHSFLVRRVQELVTQDTDLSGIQHLFHIHGQVFFSGAGGGGGGGNPGAGTGGAGGGSGGGSACSINACYWWFCRCHRPKWRSNCWIRLVVLDLLRSQQVVAVDAGGVGGAGHPRYCSTTLFYRWRWWCWYSSVIAGGPSDPQPVGGAGPGSGAGTGAGSAGPNGGGGAVADAPAPIGTGGYGGGGRPATTHYAGGGGGSTGNSDGPGGQSAGSAYNWRC